VDRAHEGPGLAAVARAIYSELCRKNVVPLLGAFTLTKLQPAHISQAYAKALTSGRRDGQGGLSARTVTHIHRVLREALQQAVRCRCWPAILPMR